MVLSSGSQQQLSSAVAILSSTGSQKTPAIVWP